MPTLKGQTAVTFHLMDEDHEDLKILCARRGQSMSEFIRRAIDRELHEEAIRQVS
jgi:predicted DNA-binding protein